MCSWLTLKARVRSIFRWGNVQMFTEFIITLKNKLLKSYKPISIISISSLNSMKSHPISVWVQIYQVYICLQEIWVRLTYLMISCWTWYYFWAHWKNFKHKIIKFKSHAASNHVESYKNEQHRNGKKKTLWYMRYCHVISLGTYLVFAKLFI